MKSRKLIALGLTAAMAAGVLAGCGGGSSAKPAETQAAAETEAAESAAESAAEGETEAAAPAAEGAGKVYYLNFKPEADQAWQDLAKVYTDQTGVPVTVVTAASGQYETTLMAEIAKSDAPTLFQVNGPVGLANWKDYCYDLTGSDIVSNLTSDAFELKDGDAIDGVGYCIETYGIIVNKTLLEKCGHTLDEITSFDSLKAVADDIQARKDELGIKGAFSSAGMDGSSDWRFKTHLANLPIYYEYQADGIDDTAEIKGTYLDNYKNVFDLYITDSTCDPAELSSKTGDDSRNEFLAGEAVFYQNGTWEYASLAETYTDDEMAMIPIYFGVDDANQGLCTGCENYWCVNSEAAEEDIQATLDFINWVVTSPEGTKMMSEQIGVIPFKDAVESANLFVKQDAEMSAAGKTPVAWTFTTMPSEEWKNGLGSALTAYAAGTGSWDDVVSAFVDNWASEKALTAV